MAEGCSIAVDTVKGLKLLKDALTDYKHQDNIIEDLYNEADGTLTVIERFNELPAHGKETLSDLEVPLRHCNRKCQELKQLIEDCTAHSTAEKRSLRDFVKLHWCGRDISDFKTQLNGYKLTVIAATMTIMLKRGLLSESEMLVQQAEVNATVPDLKRRLEETNENLKSLREGCELSHPDKLNERGRLLDEKDSTICCIDICNASLQEMQQRSRSFDAVRAASSGIDGLAFTMTAHALRESGLPMERVIGTLGEHLERVEKQLEAEDLQHQLRVTENFTHLAEAQRITLRDVRAEEGASQVMFRNDQGGIDASNVYAGCRAFQFFGNADDTLVQSAMSEHTSRIRLGLSSENATRTAKPDISYDKLANRMLKKAAIAATRSVEDNVGSDDAKDFLPETRDLSWRRITPLRRMKRKQRH